MVGAQVIPNPTHQVHMWLFLTEIKYMSHLSGQCWSMEKISALDIFTPKERDREITGDMWQGVEIQGTRNWELSSSGRQLRFHKLVLFFGRIPFGPRCL